MMRCLGTWRRGASTSLECRLWCPMILRLSGGYCTERSTRFAELIARYQQHVAKITNRHVPSDRVAEVAHDVFVRAYTSLSSFSGQTPFEHWLSGIAVRTCYDFWRARRREELPVSALTTEHQAWMDHVLAAESDDQFREQARRQEAAELLQWALGHLSAENRLVLHPGPS